jgi:hypothetical protein
MSAEPKSKELHDGMRVWARPRTPKKRGRRCALHLHPHAQFLLLPNAGHNDWFGLMTADRWQQVLVWLQR